ncbi:MAG TPA: hypothetical protein PLP90_05950, partial [Methanoculleus sp.]|nr:hypothetical protein [Methanoculleus sp.]
RAESQRLSGKYPLSRRRVSGRVRAQRFFEVRPTIFAAVLATAAAGVLIAPFVTDLTTDELRFIAFAAALTLWLLFLLVSGVRRERRCG